MLATLKGQVQSVDNVVLVLSFKKVGEEVSLIRVSDLGRLLSQQVCLIECCLEVKSNTRL